MNTPPSPLRLTVLVGSLVFCALTGAPLLVVLVLGVLAVKQGVLILTSSTRVWPG